MTSLPIPASASQIASALPRRDRILAAIVVAIAVLLGMVAYRQFLLVDRLRWDGPIHDRSAHCLLGISLAVDLREGNVRQLVSDLDGARTWPPLHGLLVAATLLVGGVDHRLAVLPSLVGWMLTVTFGFLLARRVAPRSVRNLAGSVALVLILASPAHRVYATDVMLESLGAGLTLTALYLFVAGVQSNAPRTWRSLAIVLTVLFLHKYNYWMLVVLAGFAAEVLARPGAAREFVLARLQTIDWRRSIVHQLRHPLTYVLASLFAILAWVELTGGDRLVFQGVKLSLQSTHNLLHAMYAVAFLRVATAVWPRRHTILAGVDERYRLLLAWHALPLAVWFLLPKRLGYFIWFLSPANHGAHDTRNVVDSATFYWHSIVADYHLAEWSAFAVVALIAVAFLRGRALRPGSIAVLIFLVLAVVLTIRHPNQKSRYLHSWIAVGWVLAGVGATALAAAIQPRGRPWLAGAALVVLAGMHARGFLQVGHAPERGLHDLRASVLDITDEYLPRIATARRPAVLSDIPFKHLARWSYLERFQKHGKLETDVRTRGASCDAPPLSAWLESTPCDAIVFVHVPRGSYFHDDLPTPEPTVGLDDALRRQARFRLVHERRFPETGCEVTVWRRAEAHPVPGTASREDVSRSAELAVDR